METTVEGQTPLTIDRETAKARWLAALRDPARRQTQNVLEHINSDGTKEQCCLGVLCEVAGARREVHGDGVVYYELNGQTERAVPPYPLYELFGESSNFKLPGLRDRYGERVYLAVLNDDDRMPLSQIADLVEYFL